MGYSLKQSSHTRPLVFRMVDSTDHVTPKTGLSPTVAVSKNGGSFASPSGAVTEIGNGWYKVAAHVADTDTIGPLLLHATASGADPSDESYNVVGCNIDPLAVPVTSEEDVAVDFLTHRLPRNSVRVQICPYDSVDTSTGNWGKSAAGSRDFITVGKKYQIRQNGHVDRAQFYTYAISNYTAFYLKIWRKIDDKYFLVGETPNLVDQISDTTTNTVYFPPIKVKEGDYCGYRMVSSGGAGSLLTVRSGLTGVTSYFFNDSTMNPDGESLSGMTSYAGFAVPILLFSRAPHIIGIGDSIVCGAPAHGSYVQTVRTDDDPESSITAKVGNALHCTYQNMGIGSETSAMGVARFTADVLSLYPRIAIIEFGVNDLSTGVPQATYIANMTSMLDDCVEHGIIPVVCQIAPWSNGTNEQMQTRDAWKAAIVQLLENYPTAVLVDLDEYLGEYRAGGDDGNLWDIQSVYDADGVHFTVLGYTRYADAILDALGRAGLLADDVSMAAAEAAAEAVEDLWEEGGELNNAIDQIAEDVAGLDGEGMRGTDGALTGLPSDIPAAWATSIVAGVWPSWPTRSLTGSTLSLGPTASRSRTDGYYTCPQGGTIGLYRRILNWDGADLTQADVTSITYSIFALSGDEDAPTRAAVDGHEDVSLTVADVLFDEVQSDEWASDYNFRHIPDISENDAFTVTGTVYLVEYTITPASGQKIIERIRVNAT